METKAGLEGEGEDMTSTPVVEADLSNEELLEQFRVIVLMHHAAGTRPKRYVDTARAAVLARMSTPTPGRAAEPDTMGTGDEAEALAMVQQLIAMGDNRTFRASTVLALMNERSDQRSRAKTAEAQLATMRAAIQDADRTTRSTPSPRVWRVDAEKMEVLRTLLSNPKAVR